MHNPVRRAFTLIDTAVACAAAALAVAALLPMLSASRNASQGDLSRANLKTLIRAHLAYTVQNQGKWMNPFNPTTSYNGVPNAADPEWFSVRVPGMPGFVWRMNDQGYQTEMFSFFWASVARPGPMAVDPLSPAQFDPRDQQFINRLNNLAQSGQSLAGWMWPGSYMYSPTMWFNQQRYAGAARPSIAAPNQLGGVRSVRYNTVAETLYPSRKAVLFQRFDFDQQSRNGPNGPVQLSPQWNNPAATPDVAFADGSVDEVSIRKIQNAITADPANVDVLQPTTPNWNLPSALLNDPNVGYELGTQWENGQNITNAWQAFFWGTRNGVAGRDVPQR